MLIAIEGPSAVGKTTALRAFPPEAVLGEEAGLLGLSRAQRPADPLSEAAFQFWATWSERRWERLLDLEARHGTAFADTDPLKLYYSFATVAVGAAPHAAFDGEIRHARASMVAARLGFVDHVVLLQATPATLAARRDRDREATGRRRGNFALNVRLGPAMETYYGHLEAVRPGTVHVLEAEGDPLPAVRALVGRLTPHGHARHDPAALDRLGQRLDSVLVSRP